MVNTRANPPATEVSLDIIAIIESNNNPLAVSYKDAKYGRGLYQISEIALQDYNNAHPASKMPANALFKSEINEKIAHWYLEIRIPQMLKAYHIPDTIEHRLIAYNWGIGNLKKWYSNGKKFNKLPKETMAYLKKYALLCQVYP